MKVIDIQVPSKAPSGSSVELKCKFDLGGYSLYSLTWWHGGYQFYQYTPGKKEAYEQIKFYEAPGLDVDVSYILFFSKIKI